jgi:4-oxalocrotonate tautomerase
VPHVIVKLYPGRTEDQKERLAAAISADVQRVLNYGPESVSVALQEVAPTNWESDVYERDIAANLDLLYKKPGYGRLAERRK